MTLFFNLETFKNIPDVSLRLHLLETLYYRKLPKSTTHTVLLHKLKGKSFILNPGPLFKDKKVDPLYIIQYINLAGTRDYTMYKQYGLKYLDITYYPELDFSTVSRNPLLQLKNKQLFFYYEELKRKI